jgi:hypothetical protein
MFRAPHCHPLSLFALASFAHKHPCNTQDETNIMSTEAAAAPTSTLTAENCIKIAEASLESDI